MVGGKPFNTEHKLNEYKHIKPVKQKKSGLGPGHNEATCKEVDELTKAKILRKVKDQTWVANPVMMAKGDKDKTAFFTEKGVFCYQKMPFGLKNAGATYQRLVDEVFNDQIGRNLEAYVHDMGATKGRTKLPRIKEAYIKPRSRSKWAIELGEHDIEFKGRNSVKGQVPSDFLVKTPPEEDNEKEISKVGTIKRRGKIGKQMESVYRRSLKLRRLSKYGVLGED
ncbi:hypothetical protein Tco_0655323 [Tanacetum coccineum]|uniref:Reverse transcriptase domain-containing protein n=1 Tax=Tanacetum coccineum TaxID=301880 RepID=A0ABQ4X5P3_9ASTR